MLSVTALLGPHWFAIFPMTIFPSYKHRVHTRSFITSKYFGVVMLISLYNCLAEQTGYMGPAYVSVPVTG